MEKNVKKTMTNIEPARKKFEEYIQMRGLDFEWDGARYTSKNIQVKWMYFYLGWNFSKE